MMADEPKNVGDLLGGVLGGGETKEPPEPAAPATPEPPPVPGPKGLTPEQDAALESLGTEGGLGGAPPAEVAPAVGPEPVPPAVAPPAAATPETAKSKVPRSNEPLLASLSLDEIAENWTDLEDAGAIDTLFEDLSADQLNEIKRKLALTLRDKENQPLSDMLKDVKSKLLDKIKAKLASIPAASTQAGAVAEQPAGQETEATPEKEVDQPISKEEVERRSGEAKTIIVKLIDFERKNPKTIRPINPSDLTRLLQLVNGLDEVHTIGEYDKTKGEILEILARYGHQETIASLFKL